MSYLINNTTANSIFINNPATAAIPGSATSYTIDTGVSNGSWSSSPMTVKQSGQIELKGENADIIVNGKSLSDAIAAIESRLALLTPNTKLEAEWAELKRIGDEYRKMEQEIKDKMKTWDILNKE